MRAAAALLFAALALAGTLAAGDEGCPDEANVPVTVPSLAFGSQGLRIGIALGSGSFHGLAHIGVLQELEARGVEVSVVAGTSVGALIGSLWASGMDAHEIERLGRANNWADVGSFSASWQGILDNARLRSQLTALFKGRPIESWPRRFGAVSTNLANGHRRLLMSGDGAIAVQASSAVPVLYAPVIVTGEHLADGALVEPVPVDAARDLGADYVIAVDVAYRPYEEASSGLAGNAFQAMHILINTLGERQQRNADFALRLDLHHQMRSCGTQALIAAGREAMRRAWPDLARSLRARAAAGAGVARAAP